MRFSQIACAAALTAVVYATPSPVNNAGNGADSTALLASALQSGSFNNGIQETGSEAGEAASTISTNNFINNCAGKTLTNGLQITTGSCNGISKWSNFCNHHEHALIQNSNGRYSSQD
jgi:hypothetical protein